MTTDPIILDLKSKEENDFNGYTCRLGLFGTERLPKLEVGRSYYVTFEQVAEVNDPNYDEEETE